MELSVEWLRRSIGREANSFKLCFERRKGCFFYFSYSSMTFANTQENRKTSLLLLPSPLLPVFLLFQVFLGTINTVAKKFVLGSKLFCWVVLICLLCCVCDWRTYLVFLGPPNNPFLLILFTIWVGAKFLRSSSPFLISGSIICVFLL